MSSPSSEPGTGSVPDSDPFADFPELSERTRTAFAFAQEEAKQLITLSTAVIALTITFLSDVTEGGPNGWLIAAWFLYIVCIVAGVGTLMTLSGNLEKRHYPSVYEKNTTVFGGAQVLSFAAATLLVVIFGVTAL
ncbi:MAG TPA: hypothetical protein VH683_00360 [Thermoleophilaceae bacterium]|jgi:hypothetical protein